MKYRLESGWLSGARRVLSPHCDSRPADCSIDLLVIHCISLPPGQYGGRYIDDLFLGQLDASAHPYFAEIEGLRVSAHILIDREGRVTQYVPLELRAWHAGQSQFEGRCNCNDFSIGIELEGLDTDSYTDVQYRVLAQVSAAIMASYPVIDKSRITGHSNIAPGRKLDPGPGFDWDRYFRELDQAAVV
ncbi:1,6-anhydro-N-acetylmuramyl-L-alanine amidase AmpD [Microbulbifer thermotolerans]|uniref:1,6-anhydro-N-acetylmuramyl-L-alanine amidase AmpD n=1 Tax=Microbulbifer thermotolerans TaxID=252514 RepID=UPI0022494487|nr:1,6-anhydro-N-acetylmuramyl-L-alanine amidase AmpD [Microbulbifer thermotolerans]MCX2831401.1 1,6-anhydro-N-acetylmuramyl-L-alanine amidase AmpD [Microbulbifer thermotolerans]